MMIIVICLNLAMTMKVFIVIIVMDMIEDQGREVMTMMIVMCVNLARTVRVFIVIIVMDMIEDQGTEVKTTKIKNNLVSQGLQRGQTRESEAERGSRQEFLQVVNSQRDR